MNLMDTQESAWNTWFVTGFSKHTGEVLAIKAKALALLERLTLTEAKGLSYLSMEGDSKVVIP